MSSPASTSPVTETNEPATDQYVVCLTLVGVPVLVVGGGGVATRKVRGLLGSGADITVVSPHVTEELEALSSSARITWLRREFESSDVACGRLVFAATSERTANAHVASEAVQVGAWVNVADDPAACTFHVPATLRRGRLTLAVSTQGASPLLAATIRNDLERSYGDEYGTLVELLRRARDEAHEKLTTAAARRRFYEAILDSDVLDLLREGDAGGASARIRELWTAAEEREADG